MWLHELHRLLKQPGEQSVKNEVPEEFRPYLGRYLLAGTNAEFTIDYKHDALTMYHPIQKRTSTLDPPDEEGGWASSDDRNTIYFEREPDGTVVRLRIDVANKFKR